MSLIVYCIPRDTPDADPMSCDTFTAHEIRHDNDNHAILSIPTNDPNRFTLSHIDLDTHFLHVSYGI